MTEARLAAMTLKELIGLRNAVELEIFGRIWWMVLSALIVLFWAVFLLEEIKRTKADTDA